MAAVDWQSGIRTGAYMLEKFEPGVIATVQAQPELLQRRQGLVSTRSNAWRSTTSTARTNALNTGEVHYMDRCDLKTLDLLKQNPNIVISELTGYGHYVYRR